MTERQRIALEYAERVSVTPVDVPDAFFPQLRGLFSEREIVELTAHIAHENYNAKFNRPLRVAANDCALPLPANTDAPDPHAPSSFSSAVESRVVECVCLT